MRIYIKFIIFFILVILSVTPSGVFSQPNVPLGHDAYKSIDRLSALGLIDDIFLGVRPFSRDTFAKAAVSASESLKNSPDINKSQKEVILTEIARLKYYFSEEISSLSHEPYLPVSYSISDPFTLRTSIASDDRIRKIENADGMQIGDGFDITWENASWVSFYQTAGIYGEIKRKRREDSLTTGSGNVYIWGRFKNLRAEIGKESQWWGTGRHGSMLLSNNPEPIETIRIFTEDSFKLPWLLKSIGSFNINAVLFNLEENRDKPGANIFGLRIGYKPPNNKFELGLSRITMFGGAGVPKLSPADYFRIYFSDPNQGGNFEVNELGSADLIWHADIFGLRTDIYGEIGGEDEAGLRPTKTGYITGVYLPYFAILPRGDLKIEYANNHVEGFKDIWYKHSLYTSGYTYKGDIIGHHMGNDSDDFFISTGMGIGKLGTLTLSADFERSGLSDPSKNKNDTYNIELKTYLSNKLTFNLNCMNNVMKNQSVGINERSTACLTSFSYFL